MKTLIRNVRVVDAFTDIVTDVLFNEEGIIGLGEIGESNCENIIEGNGKVLMPGFVDLHAHFRDPGFTYKEDLVSGSKAALKGGYTTVNLMANTSPVIDNMELYRQIKERAKNLDLINVEQVIAATHGLNGEKITDILGFESSVKFISDDGKGILSNKYMYDIMNLCVKANVGIMVHAEDKDLSPVDYRIAEDIITIRDVYLSGKTGCRVHFSHVSTMDSIKAIADGKKSGYPISCEVTPHHISLWDEDYRVNPPIRTKTDVDCIIKAIKKGIVDCIATDHAPHTYDEKINGAPGMTGLETSFNICYNTLVLSRHISLSKLSKIMSYNPSRILGIKSGRIAPGFNSDLVMIDLDKEITIIKDNFVSKSSNTPFEGKKYKGEILLTIVGGKVKYRRDRK